MQIVKSLEFVELRLERFERAFESQFLSAVDDGVILCIDREPLADLNGLVALDGFLEITLYGLGDIPVLVGGNRYGRSRSVVLEKRE